MSISKTNIWHPKKPHIMTDLSNKIRTHEKINDGNKCRVKRLSMATKIEDLNQRREETLSLFYRCYRCRGNHEMLFPQLKWQTQNEMKSCNHWCAGDKDGLKRYFDRKINYKSSKFDINGYIDSFSFQNNCIHLL